MVAQPSSCAPLRLTTLVRRVLAVLAAVTLVAGVLACGAGPVAVGTPDEKAAQQVQEYFAGKGARYVEGIAVENIQVTEESRGRTLSVRFVSDGSDQAGGSLYSLYYMSVSPQGWIAELNAAGLNLAWVDMVFDYGDGSPDTLEVDVARHAIIGSTRLRRGPPTTGETPAATAPSSAVKAINDAVGEALLTPVFEAPAEVVLTEAAQNFSPPDTFPVYQLLPGETLTRESMDAVATKLGFESGREYWPQEVRDSHLRLMFWTQDPDCFQLQDMTFDTDAMEQMGAGKTVTAPPPQAARQAADKYLASTGYDAGLEFLDTCDGWMIADGTADNSGHPIATGVRYRVMLGDVPLVGDQAIVEVDIGPEGQVVGFTHMIQKSQRAGIVTLRPVSEAIQALKAGLAERLHTLRPADARVQQLRVDGIEVAYYEAATASRETYYKPVYLFHCTTDKGTTADWVVSAFAATGGRGIPTEPPAEQRKQLDALDSVELIRTYLTTTDQSVLFYISSPRLRSEMLLPNRVPEQRHEDDIANLVIDGPREGSLDPGEYAPDEWPIQQQFTAQFDLLRDRNSGLGVGPAYLFVYVGRQSPNSPWKILGAGTGP